MIRLTKTRIPEVLRVNRDEWTKELLDTLKRGEKPYPTLKRRYAHPSIKEAILAETNGKCAYCESNFRHVDPGDIEHVIPKSKVPEQSFDWNNLTVSCSVCNTSKGNKLNLIDPYKVDPDQYLVFSGPYVSERPGSEKGWVTVNELNLNRIALIESRMKRLDYLKELVKSFMHARENDTKEAIMRVLERETQPDKEYAAMARTFIQQRMELIQQQSVRDQPAA